MPRVVHFEIHAEEPARAAAFYTALFNWKIEQWSGMDYWLVTTGPDDRPGINGGITRRRGTIDGQAVIAYVCTIDVDNVDASVASAVKHGGLNVMPKMAVPGVGWLAYCKDTEGNIFGVMQNDPEAR